jgi:[ribosomal protein S18]-alanine N-acetyltransferase
MLRALTELDIPELVTIEALTQQSPWSEDIFKKCMAMGSQGWVILYSLRIVGFVVLFSKVGEGHILNIAVHPDYQRRGYGQQLLNKVISAAEEEALTVIFLEVRSSNHHAIALYKKMGFHQIGVRKNYYVYSDRQEDTVRRENAFEQENAFRQENAFEQENAFGREDALVFSKNLCGGSAKR